MTFPHIYHLRIWLFLAILSGSTSHAQLAGKSYLSASSGTTTPVLSITQTATRNYIDSKVCWSSLISEQEKVRKEESEKSFFQREFKPLVGGLAGALIAVPILRHYSLTASAWAIPAVALGAGLGFFLTKALTPTNPLLEPRVPGHYLAEQNFYIETICSPGEMRVSESQYLVTYKHNGKTQTARMAYDPGDRIQIDLKGRPVDELLDSTPQPAP